MMLHKHKTWRSKKYLAWVRTLPCAMTGRQPAGQVHHLIGIGHMGGMGTKAPDWAVMPLTAEAHAEMHRDINLWSDQFEYICRTLGRAIDEGVLK
jgi:hypothetical protein